MTKDLAILVHDSWDVKEGDHWLRTEHFMEKIDENFQKKWKNVMG